MSPSTTSPAIYRGTVVHTRQRPVRHRLDYRMLALWLDLDDLRRLDQTLRWFSVDKFNLFSFHGRDHLAGASTFLRDQIEVTLQAAGIDLAGGPIRVLCMPRVLNHVFNPLSLFFCYTPDQVLQAIIYEVNNTFGERHAYVLPVAADTAPIRQTCEKKFHVSPFMDMALTYRFRVSPPSDTVRIAIEVHDAAGPILFAAFTAGRSALTDGNLLRGFLRHPLLAWQVLGSIHWEALKLWSKGMRLRPHPAPPAHLFTIQHSSGPV